MGLPDNVAGLPLHPLVVHAVVVLVPLAVLGAVVIALSPAARRRYGTLVAGVTAVATLAVPIATESGENLEHVLPLSPAIATHAHLGDELLPFVAVLLVAVLALLLVDRRERRADGPGAVVRASVRRYRLLGAALAAVVVVTAGASAVQVVRVGDSGARAVWAGVPTAPVAGSER